jgi:predicted PurR-regulated permease PerM
MDAPLTRLQRLTYRVWLAVGLLVLAAVATALLLRPLAVVLAPLVVAALIVYLLNPLVAGLARRGVPRILAVLLTYVGVGGAIAGAVAVLVPLLSAQLASFAAEAPALGVTLKERLTELLAAVGLDVDLSGLFDAQAVGQEISDFIAAEENRSTVEAVVLVLTGLARSALTAVIALALGPVLAFYLLADLPNLAAGARRLVPPDRRAEVEHVAHQLTTVVGGFVRGQLIIAVAVGLLTSVALGLAQLPYFLVIGVIAGFTNLVPLLGPFVAGALGVTVALVTDGIPYALLVLVIMTGVQQIDSSVLSPLIMGRVVRIHPLAVLLGILIAAALYGVFGMLVVVPLLAAVNVLARHLWQTRVPWAEAPPGTPGTRRAPPTVPAEAADRTGERVSGP